MALLTFFCPAIWLKAGENLNFLHTELAVAEGVAANVDVVEIEAADFVADKAVVADSLPAVFVAADSLA